MGRPLAAPTVVSGGSITMGRPMLAPTTATLGAYPVAGGYGQTLTPIGDVNGDGVGDYMLGGPRVIQATPTPPLILIGDVNGDGVGDYMVGTAAPRVIQA